MIPLQHLSPLKTVLYVPYPDITAKNEPHLALWMLCFLISNVRNALQMLFLLPHNIRNALRMLWSLKITSVMHYGNITEALRTLCPRRGTCYCVKVLRWIRLCFFTMVMYYISKVADYFWKISDIHNPNYKHFNTCITDVTTMWHHPKIGFFCLKLGILWFFLKFFLKKWWHSKIQTILNNLQQKLSFYLKK